MKQTDFDRLKSVCEKEGFEVLNLTHDDNEKYVLVKKQKDTWEGVEFFQFDNKKHYKVKEFYTELIRGIDGLNYEKKHCKPSTESAYIEQLKAECFKRFGEIKEGDRFQMADGGIYTFGKTGNIEWDYFKKVDQFFYYNVELYCEGKWATRVKKRVKVDFSWFRDSDNRPLFNFHYLGANAIKSVLEEKTSNELKNIGDFLASKLEEYLNEE